MENMVHGCRERRRLLTGVAVVCRAHPQINADDICRLIDEFADPTARWSVYSACEKAPIGLRRLLKRINTIYPEDIDPLVKQQHFAVALVHAVRHGDLTITHWLVEVFLPSGRIRQAMKIAAEHGRLEILQWMHANHAARIVWSHEVFIVAAEQNHLEVVKWLHGVAPRTSWDDLDLRMNVQDILKSAAMNGNLEMIQWIGDWCKRDGIWVQHGSAINRAARSGHRAAVELISDVFGCLSHSFSLNDAVVGGRLEVAQWLHSDIGLNEIEMSDLRIPAARGQFELIKWAFDTLRITAPSCDFHTIVEHAAANGHLDVIKLVLEHYDGSYNLKKAARNGHLHVLKWVHENGTSGFTSHVMDKAARGGHLDIIKWLHTHRSEGCTSRAMNLAASNNHLDVAKWLHANWPQSISAGAMDGAAEGGHLEMLKWLHETCNPVCSFSAMDKAARNGHLDVIKWLHAHRREGCSFRAMDNAAWNGHLEVVEWLHVNRSEGCSEQALMGAARCGYIHIVNWLIANKPDASGQRALHYAAACGDFDVIWAIDKVVRPIYVPDYELFLTASAEKNYEVLEWLIREYGVNTPHLADWFRNGKLSGKRKYDPYITEIVARLLDIPEDSSAR